MGGRVAGWGCGAAGRVRIPLACAEGASRSLLIERLLDPVGRDLEDAAHEFGGRAAALLPLAIGLRGLRKRQLWRQSDFVEYHVVLVNALIAAASHMQRTAP